MSRHSSKQPVVLYQKAKEKSIEYRGITANEKPLSVSQNGRSKFKTVNFPVGFRRLMFASLSFKTLYLIPFLSANAQSNIKASSSLVPRKLNKAAAALTFSEHTGLLIVMKPVTGECRTYNASSIDVGQPNILQNILSPI